MTFVPKRYSSKSGRALCLLLVAGASSCRAFQLRPSSTTIAPSTTTSGPYQHCYFHNNNNKICTPLQAANNNNNNKRKVSLYVSQLPQQQQQDDKSVDFFFRAPFPAEMPVIPSELTDDVLGVVTTTGNNALWNSVLESYWGPRLVLLTIAAVYGTNFPLGAIMNDALPASAATCARMVLATLALSPFLVQIKPHLRAPAVLCGCFTALGYVSQSLALVDTDPSKVSFLGAATVLWCPVLEWLVEGKPMGVRDAPQTWLAAVLCMVGVGVLELYQPGGGGDVALDNVAAAVTQGDLLAIVQAIGFGTGCFLSARMVQKEPDQVLPITSVLVATTAFWSMLWCFMDGWMDKPGAEVMTLPNLLFAPGFETVAMAVVWTGLISTSLNFVIEISALGRVKPSEASVLLASEPLWAALLAASVFQVSDFGANDYIGGACILMACLANAVLKPSDFHGLWGNGHESQYQPQDPPELRLKSAATDSNSRD